MVSAVLSSLARVRVTLAYAVLLAGVATVLPALGPQAQDQVVRHASTNLHNLSHGHLGTLLASAFVVDAGPIYLWLPGLVCLLAVAELLWRSNRLVIAFTFGHIGATLLVAGGLTAAVMLGWLPVSVSRATDVGMSYGAAGVLGALTAAIPRRWRPGWVGWWLGVGVAVCVVGRDFTDVGHAVALVLGMGVSAFFGRPDGWTPRRFLLLVVAVAFGYLLLVNSGPALVAATGSALAGAALGSAVRPWCRSRRTAAQAGTPTVQRG